MAKVVTITNGTGTGELINDSYTLTADVTGYNNASIDPSTLNVVEGTDSYSLTIAATGTLTLHVTEEGTSSGTPIVGAAFIRTDSQGTEYGTQITTDSNGDAVFSNVPFVITETFNPIFFAKAQIEIKSLFNVGSPPVNTTPCPPSIL